MLSFAVALRRAEAHNPSLLSQSYAGRSADALIDQAAVRPNPTLDVTLENFAGSGAFRAFDGVEATVQLSQPLERRGKREKRILVARRELEVAERGFAVRRAEVLAATAGAYVEVLAAQEQLSHSAASLSLVQETVEVVALRVKAAVASSAESARARASLAFARADHTRAEAALTVARAALASLWGGGAAEVPALTDVLPVPVELPDQEILFSKLSAHLRFELQQAVIASHRASLQFAQAQSSQDVTVAGGVRFLRERSDAAFVAGLSVPLPFRGQNQGNIRAARETLAGSEQSVRALDVELRAVFTATWRDLQLAMTVARNLRAEALPATEEALSIIRGAYARGETPLLDVLEAQRAAAALRRDLLNADTNAAVALVRLDSLTDPTFPLTTALLSRR